MLPVGFHNSMETLKMQMERRGVVYAGRSNMAILAVVKDEPRSFYYAPGTTTAIMAGGNWQPMLQTSQWRVFHVGDEHLAASEEDDAIYQLKLDSLGACHRYRICATRRIKCCDRCSWKRVRGRRPALHLQLQRKANWHG